MTHYLRTVGILILAWTLAIGVTGRSGAQEALPLPSGFDADDFSEVSEIFQVLVDTNVVSVSGSNRLSKLQLLDATGRSLSPEAGSMVAVVDPTGSLRRVTPDASGLVAVEAQPGLHAIIVSDPNGHAAIPFAVRESAAGAEAVESTPIPVPTFNIPRPEVSQAALKFLPPGNQSTIDIDYPLVTEGRVIGSRRYHVRLDADGKMHGQLISLRIAAANGFKRLSGTNVLIHRNGRQVARAITDNKGRIVVNGLSPGPYGLIAAGRDGYAAFGFEVLASASGGSLTDDDFADRDRATGDALVSTVSLQQQLQAESDDTILGIENGDILPIVPVPLGLLPMGELANEDELAFAEELGCGCDSLFGCGCGSAGGAAGGPGGGGFGGGGGGGVGGLGGGGLLGLAGLAAAIAIGLDSDDDNIVVPPATAGFVIE